MRNKRIMVDMSLTICIMDILDLKKAAQLGDVIVGLTTDEEIKNKGYVPKYDMNKEKKYRSHKFC